MKYIISFFCSILSMTAIAQIDKTITTNQKDVDFVMNTLIDSLKKSTTGYIIAVSRNIEGGFPDSIGFPSYRYIFWLRDSNTYFQEIRGYFDHDVVIDKPKMIIKSEVFSFLNRNYDSIKDDFILPFIKKYKFNGIECYEPVHGLHGAGYVIYILTKNGGVSKEFEQIDLQESFGTTLINLNSEHNNKSKLKKLWDLLWTVIKDERDR